MRILIDDTNPENREHGDSRMYFQVVVIDDDKVDHMGGEGIYGFSMVDIPEWHYPNAVNELLIDIEVEPSEGGLALLEEKAKIYVPYDDIKDDRCLMASIDTTRRLVQAFQCEAVYMRYA